MSVYRIVPQELAEWTRRNKVARYSYFAEMDEAERIRHNRQVARRQRDANDKRRKQAATQSRAPEGRGSWVKR